MRRVVAGSLQSCTHTLQSQFLWGQLYLVKHLLRMKVQEWSALLWPSDPNCCSIHDTMLACPYLWWDEGCLSVSILHCVLDTAVGRYEASSVHDGKTLKKILAEKIKQDELQYLELLPWVEEKLAKKAKKRKVQSLPGTLWFFVSSSNDVKYFVNFNLLSNPFLRVRCF